MKKLNERKSIGFGNILVSTSSPKNNPVIINNIDDFYKHFGRPDNSFMLEKRRKKIERIQKIINNK